MLEATERRMGKIEDCQLYFYDRSGYATSPTSGAMYLAIAIALYVYDVDIYAAALHKSTP